MTAPTDPREQVPPHVALVRIAAVIGMSAAMATGVFVLLGWPERWILALVLMALAIPCFGLMRLVENAGAPPDEGQSS
jgi:hypothetical protein